MSRWRRVLAITGTRAEFGIMQSVLKALRDDEAFELRLVVTGGHLLESLGSTWREIVQAGFTIDERVPLSPVGAGGEAVAVATGEGMARLAEVISRIDPDGVLLVGDRYETFAAASAAYLCHVPVAHCHGGEITRGAMDDALRHAITKLSHVHFASTEQYAGRIRQLGEEPWRVHVSGAPGLDTLRDAPLLSGAELAPTIGHDPSVEPTAVLTYHPATLADEAPGATFELLARALEMRDLRVVITGPNADPGSEEILAGIRAYTARSDRAMHAPSLGHLRYMSLLACAACMVGNSSSGIIEAGSFALPVVNVGRRQEGRTSGPNVIHVEADAAGIKRGIDQALSDETRRSLEGMENPYGTGRSWEKIVNALGRLPSREALLCKGFSDWTGGE